MKRYDLAVVGGGFAGVAEALGDATRALTYRELYEKGREWTNERRCFCKPIFRSVRSSIP